MLFAIPLRAFAVGLLALFSLGAMALTLAGR